MATSKQPAKDATETPAVPLACVVCRERHLKCDGEKPSCSRCIDSKQSCYYVQSRRGHRPSRKRQRSSEAVERSFLTYNDSSASPSSDDRDGIHFVRQDSYDPRAVARVPYRVQPEASLFIGVGRAKLREMYYYYFHDAHPILVPQMYLPQIPVTATPPAVDAIMDYVGAQYSPKTRADPSYLRRLQASLYAKDAKRDGYTVQALLLLGIVQRAHDQNELAFATFNEAIDLALHLGMNHSTFARIHGGGSPIVQEMWRRVWWELYVNDLLLAAMRHASYSRMFSIQSDVELPWEEMEYRCCTPGATYTLRDFDQYLFFDDEAVSFSSFAYRIAASRSIGRLLKLNQSFCPDSTDLVVSIDIAINNWILHLPEGKQTPLGKDGRIDEMMFQAHMMTNAASICLHRPRSDLVFTDVQDTTTCTPGRSYGVPATKYSVHTAKCIQAADRIADLITMPGDTLQHTPLFTCMLTLSSVVHLSAYILSHNTEQRAQIRDRLGLSVGSLKSIKDTWAIAESVLGSVKGAAKEVMAIGAQINAPVIAPSEEYSTRISGNEPWMITLEDPLFTEVPDLLPTDEQTMNVLASLPGSNPSIPVTVSYA